jgi:hypothetical protein
MMTRTRFVGSKRLVVFMDASLKACLNNASFPLTQPVLVYINKGMQVIKVGD